MPNIKTNISFCKEHNFRRKNNKAKLPLNIMNDKMRSQSDRSFYTTSIGAFKFCRLEDGKELAGEVTVSHLGGMKVRFT